MFCLLGCQAKSFVQKLQRVQNKAARLIVRAGKTVPTTPIMGDLHWFPVAERIMFKVLIYAFKAIHDTVPSYVSTLVEVRSPGRTLRSSTGPPRLEPPGRGKKAQGLLFVTSRSHVHGMPCHVNSKSSAQ